VIVVSRSKLVSAISTTIRMSGPQACGCGVGLPLTPEAGRHAGRVLTCLSKRFERPHVPRSWPCGRVVSWRPRCVAPKPDRRSPRIRIPCTRARPAVPSPTCTAMPTS
jgi:hypothetical protein